MENKRAVILFTRVPLPGQTKTRMMPYFDARQCAKLHSSFLKDIAKECSLLDADIFVCYTPEDKGGLLKEIFGERPAYFLQKGGNLGERMYQAIEEVLGKGYDSCVLMGTDVPEVRAEDLEEAFLILRTKEIVFGPVSDGGYYLVGMKQPRREVFEKQSYGHGAVLECTLDRLKEVGISAGMIRKLNDMDVPEDLNRFRDRMRTKKGLQLTQTGKYLMRTSRISVIVPVYNEEKTIEKLQKQLKTIQDKCEILIVDGGSTDKTLELINPEFHVLHSEKGRANQMNLGAKESHGDILFFLHCDSELPPHPLEEIRYVMKDHRVGCFGIAFHSKNFFMYTCRVISNHRIQDRKVMFGDQGIFIDRKLFFEVGMFPELPIMEDYQFSLNLKTRGEKIGMAKHRIYTSDRRFPKNTISKLQIMWKINRLRKMYRDGVPIEQIAQMYRDVR